MRKAIFERLNSTECQNIPNARCRITCKAQIMISSVMSRNNVKTWGTGEQVMILAHGFGCDQQMWRYITPAFENDYRIVLFDYVGAGKSDVSMYSEERYSTLYGYADDLLEVCEALDIKNAIFVGHSVSSMIGVIASIRRPTLFQNLILIGPSACYINDDSYVGGFNRSDVFELLDTMDKNYIGWANFLAPAIMANADRPELGEELTGSFCSTDPKIARKFAEVTFLSDNRKDLHQTKVPSLIMQCSDDIIAPLQVGDYLQKNLPGSTLRVMKATGHCPHMSSPDETVEIIKWYLKSF